MGVVADTRDRLLVDTETDKDAAVAVAVDKVGGAVDGVNHPRRLARQVILVAVRRRVLLADDQVVRPPLADHLADHRLALLVRLGD